MPQTQRPIQDKDIRPLPYGQGAYRLVYPGGAGDVYKRQAYYVDEKTE